MPSVYRITDKPESRERALQGVMAASKNDVVTFTRVIDTQDETLLGMAVTLVRKLKSGWSVSVKKRNRSIEQNNKMWAMLTDISRSMPIGLDGEPIRKTADQWKTIIMHALKYQCQFECGLDGQMFPTGLSTSSLNIAQMSELIEFMYSYGAEHNIDWSDPETRSQAQDYQQRQTAA